MCIVVLYSADRDGPVDQHRRYRLSKNSPVGNLMNNAKLRRVYATKKRLVENMSSRSDKRRKKKKSRGKLLKRRNANWPRFDYRLNTPQHRTRHNWSRRLPRSKMPMKVFDKTWPLPPRGNSPSHSRRRQGPFTSSLILEHSARIFTRSVRHVAQTHKREYTNSAMRVYPSISTYMPGSKVITHPCWSTEFRKVFSQGRSTKSIRVRNSSAFPLKTSVRS